MSLSIPPSLLYSCLRRSVGESQKGAFARQAGRRREAVPRALRGTARDAATAAAAKGTRGACDACPMPALRGPRASRWVQAAPAVNLRHVRRFEEFGNFNLWFPDSCSIRRQQVAVGPADRQQLGPGTARWRPTVVARTRGSMWQSARPARLTSGWGADRCGGGRGGRSRTGFPPPRGARPRRRCTRPRRSARAPRRSAER